MVGKMADETDPTEPPFLRLPPVAPHGGSKWARHFAGPDRVTVARPGTITLRDASIGPDGIAAAPPDGEIQEQTVFALPAGAAVSLGQFLTGPLNIALALPPPSPTLCGPALTPRQTEILARIGRLRDYTPLAGPRAFRNVIAAVETKHAVPGDHIRPLTDRLRAGQAAKTGAIAILPVREKERFCLANRASLAAWLRARRITVIDPEALRLTELLDSLAAAPLVLLADPSQSGLLALCHPGTKILEIAPEGWLGAQARHLCAMFGLAWTPFLATPPSYRLEGALPFGSLVPCSYEVPIRALAETLK